MEGGRPTVPAVLPGVRDHRLADHPRPLRAASLRLRKDPIDSGDPAACCPDQVVSRALYSTAVRFHPPLDLEGALADGHPGAVVPEDASTCSGLRPHRGFDAPDGWQDPTVLGRDAQHGFKSDQREHAPGVDLAPLRPIRTPVDGSVDFGAFLVSGWGEGELGKLIVDSGRRQRALLVNDSSCTVPVGAGIAPHHQRCK